MPSRCTPRIGRWQATKEYDAASAKSSSSHAWRMPPQEHAGRCSCAAATRRSASALRSTERSATHLALTLCMLRSPALAPWAWKSCFSVTAGSRGADGCGVLVSCRARALRSQFTQQPAEAQQQAAQSPRPQPCCIALLTLPGYAALNIFQCSADDIGWSRRHCRLSPHKSASIVGEGWCKS